MKKCVIIIGIITIFFATSCQESLPDRCVREAREYTEKNCPIEVEKNVILDSMTFTKSSLTINYFYSLQDILDNEEMINTQKDNISSTMLAALKNATNMKVYMENDYKFRYIYFSTKNQGKTLLEINFEKEDYK